MRKFIFSCVMLGSFATVAAQNPSLSPDNWYFGFGGGTHFNFMDVTKIDKDLYPDSKSLFSGVGSIFIEGSFGSQNQFAIRPEVNFLNRGGSITGIKSNVPGFYRDNDIKDIRYEVKSHYIDVRLPLIYQFCSAQSAIRPYVFVAPIAGFSTGGYIRGEEQYYTKSDNSYGYDGVNLDLTKANYNAFYFAAGVGAGLKWQFNVGRHTCFLALEAMYEYGVTDTYGKDKDAKYKYTFFDGAWEENGTRKYQGVEVKVNLGIPFSVFKKAAPAPVIEEVVEVVEEVVPEPVKVVETPKVVEKKVEKPCYTLEEITDLMAKGQPVEGKTICALDDAINFQTGKSTIEKQSYPYLNQLAEVLKRTNSKIIIKGHTDNVGTEENNMVLSKNRALSVYNYLVKNGVPESKLSYQYFGMSRPLTTNDTPEGRRLNRRVEFEISK